jgi:HEPN domain-containing protein
MGNRYSDWLKQADADLRHARHSLAAGDHEWCCFAAHQAAEKALKGLYLHAGKEAWGHTLSALLGEAAGGSAVGGGADPALFECAKTLDKHYIPTRYPNGFDSGAPTDFYTRQEGETAIGCAERIIGFCKGHIEGSPQPGTGG